MRQLEKAFLWIVKIGLWLIPLIPLYVSSSMLFPFITGKNFTFRIITEVIFALWAGLAISRPEYRPRLTPLFKIITIFIGIVFLADLLSPNPYRAFFSNYERMEGFMMLGHLYLYFVMLISVFKTRRDWLIFFHISLAASLVASYFGLLQRLGYRISLQGGFRVDSTIGNPTYFAAYLLFHIWLLGILIYRYLKTWWLTALYVAILLFELAIIYFTATRGVVLALALVMPLFAASVVLFWERVVAGIQTPAVLSMRPRQGAAASGGHRYKGRAIAGILLCIVVLIPFTLWLLRGTDFVQSSQALRRLTNYSLTEGTIQNRFVIWRMSLKGFRERPILGWGQENYYLVFQKHYDPRLFNAETWFDRSHNVFFDWLIHTGALGLASYLAIFATAVWGIVGWIRREQKAFFEGAALLGLFLTYFFQNLFVFDNLNSYLLFFAFLSYTGYLTGPRRAEVAAERPRELSGDGSANRRYAYAVGLLLAAVVAASGWYLHARPIREGRILIRTLALMRSGGTVTRVTDEFRRALRYRSFGDTEVREQLAHAARDIALQENIPLKERKRFVEFALDELRKEITHPAKDVKHLLFFATVLNRGLALDPQRYVPEADRVLSEAVAVSPSKQPVYAERAQFYLNIGDLNRATEALRDGWRKEPRFREMATNVWTIAILAKRPDIIAEVQAVYTEEDIGEGGLFRFATAYQQINDFASARDIFAKLVTLSPRNAQYRATYAALLAQTGNRGEARRQVEEAIRIDPSFEGEGKAFLRQL